MDNVQKSKDGRDQCQMITAHGQCLNVQDDSGKWCPVHSKMFKAHEGRKNINSLRLAQWQARMEDHATDPEVKSLRGEIGVLRILLENAVTKCKDHHDLTLQSGRISDLVIKLEKLVVSCNKIESTSSLDKASLLQFGATVINIIGSHIKDPAVIEAISNDILKGMQDASSSERG